MPRQAIAAGLGVVTLVFLWHRYLRRSSPSPSSSSSLSAAPPAAAAAAAAAASLPSTSSTSSTRLSTIGDASSENETKSKASSPSPAAAAAADMDREALPTEPEMPITPPILQCLPAQPPVSFSDLVFYIPIHNVPCEQLGAFLDTDAMVRVFLYSWNQGARALTSHFFGAAVPLLDMDIRTVTKCLRADHLNGKRVVFLLSSSPNYSFGASQRRAFGHLQTVFSAVAPSSASLSVPAPSSSPRLTYPLILDVAGIGHCLFGCSSCSRSENPIPLYFSRFVNRSLPYDAAAVRRLFFPGCPSSLSSSSSSSPASLSSPLSSSSSSSSSSPGRTFNILVAPSFGVDSLLRNEAVCEAIVSFAHRTARKLGHDCDTGNDNDDTDNDGAAVNVAIKYHPILFLAPDHPFHTKHPLEARCMAHFSAAARHSQTRGGTVAAHEKGEQANVTTSTRSNAVCIIEEAYTSLLPFVEAFDIVIADLHSSVPFESLFLSPKPILAFRPKHMKISTVDVPRPPEYIRHLTLFSDVDELCAHLSEFAVNHPNGPTTPGMSGRDFVESVYGKISGLECERFARERGWFGSHAQPPAAKQWADWSEDGLLMMGQDLLRTMLASNPGSPWVYLALGEPVPPFASS